MDRFQEASTSLCGFLKDSALLESHSLEGDSINALTTCPNPMWVVKPDLESGSISSSFHAESGPCNSTVLPRYSLAFSVKRKIAR